MKSNRSAAKRFRATATGRIRFKRGFKNHILTKKSPKRIRQLRRDSVLTAADEARVKAMLPYL